MAAPGARAPRRTGPADGLGLAHRARLWWATLSFGARSPRRRVAVLALLGVMTGLGEACVVVLLVTLASRGEGGRLASLAILPSSPWALAGLGLGAVAVLALAHLGSAVTAARAASDVSRAVQAMLVRGFLDAPMSSQAAARAGELQDLVTVRTRILAMSTKEAAQAVAALLNLLVLLVVATLLSLWTTAGLVLSVLVVLLVARRFRGRRRRAMRGSVAANAALATEVTETASAARDLRVFGVATVAGDQLVARVDDAARRNQSFRTMTSATGPLTRDATVAVLILCLTLVVTQTDVSLAVLGATVLLVLRGLTQAQTLANVGVSLLEREDHVARVRHRLDAWRPPVPRGTRRCPAAAVIELQGVGHTHPGADRPALSGIDLRLARGELIGVVGRTGAGKSTLAAILLGLIAPGRGTVEVGGVPLQDVDPADWHTRTAWVGQDPQLLSGTVAENIRYLRDHLDDAALHAAAQAAGLAPELAHWPLGLDHPVGPGGVALSGGQRQRVALARALAGAPELLVLDEPTSALDAHAEAAVRDGLSAARQDRITVVIAHRPSTVQVCDRIAVLEAGRLVALAPAHELAAGSAYFREVVQLSRS